MCVSVFWSGGCVVIIIYYYFVNRWYCVMCGMMGEDNGESGCVM